MSVEFNPIKAATEALAGLDEVQRSLDRQLREVEARVAQAEGDRDALNKLAGYVRISVEAQRAVLDKLREEANR